MADELRMALAEVLRKAGVEQADFLREGVRILAEELMDDFDTVDWTLPAF